MGDRGRAGSEEKSSLTLACSVPTQRCGGSGVGVNLDFMERFGKDKYMWKS